MYVTHFQSLTQYFIISKNARTPAPGSLTMCMLIKDLQRSRAMCVLIKDLAKITDSQKFTSHATTPPVFAMYCKCRTYSDLRSIVMQIKDLSANSSIAAHRAPVTPKRPIRLVTPRNFSENFDRDTLRVFTLTLFFFSYPQKLHYNAVSPKNPRFVCIIMQFFTSSALPPSYCLYGTPCTSVSLTPPIPTAMFNRGNSRPSARILRHARLRAVSRQSPRVPKKPREHSSCDGRKGSGFASATIFNWTRAATNSAR